MLSDAPHAETIRAIVVVVSADPPIVCDLRIRHTDDGWVLEGRPHNGDEPFGAIVSSPPGPVLNWMAQAAVLAD